MRSKVIERMKYGGFSTLIGFKNFTDLILHKELLRKSCSPELQALRWVLCKVASVEYNTLLDLVVVLDVIHLLKCTAETKTTKNENRTYLLLTDAHLRL